MLQCTVMTLLSAAVISAMVVESLCCSAAAVLQVRLYCCVEADVDTGSQYHKACVLAAVPRHVFIPYEYLTGARTATARGRGRMQDTGSCSTHLQ